MVRSRKKRPLSTCKKAVTRKSRRAIRGIRNINADYQYDLESEAHRSYTINRKKALDKKLYNCSSRSIQAAIKPGNQLRLNFSTATYEVFRQAIHSYYDSGDNPKISKQLHVECKTIRDATEVNITEEQFHIHKKNKNGKPAKKCLFTINLYNTTSSALINGSQTSLFINDHLTGIENELCNLAKYHLDDKTIQAMLTSIKQQYVPNSNKEQFNVVNQGNKRLPDILSPRNDSSIECVICSKPCTTSAIECSHCHAWLHYSCENLSAEEINLHEQQQDLTDYTCSSCTYLDAENGLQDKDEVCNNSPSASLNGSISGQLIVAARPPIQGADPPILDHMEGVQASGSSYTHPLVNQSIDNISICNENGATQATNVNLVHFSSSNLDTSPAHGRTTNPIPECTCCSPERSDRCTIMVSSIPSISRNNLGSNDQMLQVASLQNNQREGVVFDLGANPDRGVSCNTKESPRRSTQKKSIPADIPSLKPPTKRSSRGKELTENESHLIEKEKLLTKKEKNIDKKLKELEDLSKQLGHSKSFIAQLEIKINQLEENERLYKTQIAALKLQPNNPVIESEPQSQPTTNVSDVNDSCAGQHSLRPCKCIGISNYHLCHQTADRLNAIEIDILRQRCSNLENQLRNITSLAASKQTVCCASQHPRSLISGCKHYFGADCKKPNINIPGSPHTYNSTNGTHLDLNKCYGMNDSSYQTADDDHKHMYTCNQSCTNTYNSASPGMTERSRVLPHNTDYRYDQQDPARLNQQSRAYTGKPTDSQLRSLADSLYMQACARDYQNKRRASLQAFSCKNQVHSKGPNANSCPPWDSTQVAKDAKKSDGPVSHTRVSPAFKEHRYQPSRLNTGGSPRDKCVNSSDARHYSATSLTKLHPVLGNCLPDNNIPDNSATLSPTRNRGKIWYDQQPSYRQQALRRRLSVASPTVNVNVTSCGKPTTNNQTHGVTQTSQQGKTNSDHERLILAQNTGTNERASYTANLPSCTNSFLGHGRASTQVHQRN